MDLKLIRIYMDKDTFNKHPEEVGEVEVSQEHGQDAVDGGEVGQGLVVILEGDHEVLQQITFDQTCQRCLTMFEWRVCTIILGEREKTSFPHFCLLVKIFTNGWLK